METIVDKYNNISDSVSDLISSKKEFIAKQIVNVFLLLLILLIFGCFDFLNLKFHFEYLADANYWIDVATKAIADICAYNIGVNFIIDDIIKRNTVLQKLKITYDKLNDCKQDDFEDFLIEYNKEQKVIAYRNAMMHKIFLFNKRSKRRDKILYNQLIKNGETYESLITNGNKYVVKRAELEYLKTDEYIKENIDSLDVRFKDIEAAVFEIEIDGSQKIVQDKVTGSLSKGRAIASTTTLFGVVTWSMVFRAISLAPSQEQFENQMIAAAHYASKMAGDIGIIIWQFTRGMLGTRKIVSQQITNPLSIRVKVLKEYYAWRKRKGLSVPDCYSDLLKENKEEVIEITEEQFNNLNK